MHDAHLLVQLALAVGNAAEADAREEVDAEPHVGHCVSWKDTTEKRLQRGLG
jgi:hypothetical protein